MFFAAFGGGFLVCPSFNPCYNGSLGKYCHSLYSISNLIIMESKNIKLVAYKMQSAFQTLTLNQNLPH